MNLDKIGSLGVKFIPNVVKVVKARLTANLRLFLLDVLEILENYGHENVQEDD